MNIQTFDPYDGRVIHREGRLGGYVRLSDYETLEKQLAAPPTDLKIVTMDEVVQANAAKVVGAKAEVITVDEEPLSEDQLARIDARIDRDSLGEKVLEAEKAMRGVLCTDGSVMPREQFDRGNQ